MDPQKVHAGLNREGVVREGGLEGSGPEERRRTCSSSGGHQGRPHGEKEYSEAQCITDPTPTDIEPRLVAPGANLAQRWVLFLGQRDFEHLNLLSMLKNQEVSHNNLDFWLLLITGRCGVLGLPCWGLQPAWLHSAVQVPLPNTPHLPLLTTAPRIPSPSADTGPVLSVVHCHGFLHSPWEKCCVQMRTRRGGGVSSGTQLELWMRAAESGNPGRFREGNLGAQETDLMLAGERDPERPKRKEAKD